MSDSAEVRRTGKGPLAKPPPSVPTFEPNSSDGLLSAFALVAAFAVAIAVAFALVA